MQGCDLDSFDPHFNLGGRLSKTQLTAEENEAGRNSPATQDDTVSGRTVECWALDTQPPGRGVLSGQKHRFRPENSPSPGTNSSN